MATTKYVWDGDDLLCELDGNDNVTVEYTHGGPRGELISERRNGTTYTHYYDAQGSTVALTDEAGNITDTFINNAFGEEVARTGNTPTPFRWLGALGYYWDSDRQLFYVRRRDYTALIGRWLQEDPLQFLLMELGLPPSHYTYANNSPILLVDPSGLACRQPGPPDSAVPSSPDTYCGVAMWRTLGGPTVLETKQFKDVKCGCCKMDIEIRARAYRYFRWSESPSPGRFLTHDCLGMTGGLSNDPLDFFSLVVVTICKTNIVCDGKRMEDSAETITSTPLEKDGTGIFIRSCATDVEHVYANFASDKPCVFAQDLVKFIEQNTQPCPADPNPAR